MWIMDEVMDLYLFVSLKFPKGISFLACASPMDGIYVIYIMLCEFLVFLLILLRLIHKKAKA